MCDILPIGDFMLFDDIKKMAEVDLKFNESELDTESLRIPQLHGKYLNMLYDEKLVLRKWKNELGQLLKLKWEYYTGKMSEEQLKELNWEPFQLRILKQDVELYMESDVDLNQKRDRVFVQEEKVNYLESIIKMISNRQYHIRDAITWRKFINGES
jgi:hypothetical protein